MATFENWGDYFWPGQIDECRRNLLGIHDPVQLERAERAYSATRAADLISGKAAVPQTYDLDHVRAIHSHLFRDVYEWAGQLRVVELVRPSPDPNDHGHQFTPPGEIRSSAENLFALVESPSDLKDRPLEERVEQLARTYAGLNVVHPFFEGNGRTQRLYLQHAAQAAGCEVDWTQMPQQNQVMAEAFTIGYRPVQHALRPCVTLQPDTASPTRDVGTSSLERLRQRTVDRHREHEKPRSPDPPAPGTPQPPNPEQERGLDQ